MREMNLRRSHARNERHVQHIVRFRVCNGQFTRRLGQEVPHPGPGHPPAV